MLSSITGERRCLRDPPLLNYILGGYVRLKGYKNKYNSGNSSFSIERSSETLTPIDTILQVGVGAAGRRAGGQSTNPESTKSKFVSWQTVCCLFNQYILSLFFTDPLFFLFFILSTLF